MKMGSLTFNLPAWIKHRLSQGRIPSWNGKRLMEGSLFPFGESGSEALCPPHAKGCVPMWMC